jgi:hypothetical protein
LGYIQALFSLTHLVTLIDCKSLAFHVCDGSRIDTSETDLPSDCLSAIISFRWKKV